MTVSLATFSIYSNDISIYTNMSESSKNELNMLESESKCLKHSFFPLTSDGLVITCVIRKSKNKE